MGHPLSENATAVIVGGLLFLAPHGASAYTPNAHQRSVETGAALCEVRSGAEFPRTTLENMVAGAREPDNFSLGGLQMLLQRFEPGSYGAKRDISTVRIAAQSLHASPSPTRPPYSGSAKDRALLKQSSRRPESELLPDRLDVELYAYDTNQAVRNKILIQASQFLCVSLAHQNQAQSARKFGNMLHTLADTYSASHVQRTPPVGGAGNCGTEKIEWFFSMDLVSWKQHVPADKVVDDWRFDCVGKHTGELMQLWLKARSAVESVRSGKAKRAAANAALRPSLRYLCRNALRQDKHLLGQPAGGAPAGYSSASGTDLWNMFRRQKADRPIQPVGLTGAKEAEAFRERINERLRKSGSPARYWYPPRSMEDLCASLEGTRALPEALQCTIQEIGWAMRGAREVRSMWIPPR